MKNNSRIRGVTFLELLVSIALVAILTSVVISISGSFIQRAKKVKCISRMRGLHSGFVAYIKDEGHWPQVPEGELDENAFFEVFYDALEPYGVGEEYWLCPSDEDMLKYVEKDESLHYGSYVPTPFDDKPGTPFRWNQPWLVERGDFHGKGGHMMMPDGSIQQQLNAFQGRR